MIHTHVHTQSLFDADMKHERLIEKIKENNWKGIVVTNHGVVSDLYDLQPLFEENGLKLGCGCEFYVDGGILGREHLVGIAIDKEGWKGLSKLVTLSNTNIQGGYPIVTFDMIKNLFGENMAYEGHVYFTSACMQGVIPAIFRLNETVENEIEKLTKKLNKYRNPADVDYMNKSSELPVIDSKLQNMQEEKKVTEKKAKQTFKKREKAIAKLTGQNKADAISLLEKDKKEAIEASSKLEVIKNNITATKKSRTALIKTIGKMEEEINNWIKTEAKINALKKEIRTDDELWKLAIDEATKYKNVLKDKFYIEIQYHGIKAEEKCYLKSVEVAKTLDIPLIASNDAHIIDNTEDERLKRQIMRSMRFGKWQEENEGDKELYLKTEAELREYLAKLYPQDVIDEAIANTDKVFDTLDVHFSKENHYPKFTDGTGRTTEEIFDTLIQEGIKWRFNGVLEQKYKDRLAYEISIIKKMDVVDYLVVVRDFLEYARLLGYIPEKLLDEAPLTIETLEQYIAEHGFKNPGMTVGPGRGSGVGSLVCYLLGITALDPMKYELLFERFLNPSRVSMPDIDSDIAKGAREKTIQYIRHKYGEKAVCLIMTKSIEAPKGAVRNAARFYGLKKYGSELTGLGSEIAKNIPARVGIKFSSFFDETDEQKGTVAEYLADKYKNNKDALEIIRWSQITEGMFYAYGEHAAGVVISDNDDISDYAPLRWNKSSNQMDCQMDMVQVESGGLLKMDVLGLKTLNVITDSMRLIEKTKGIIIDPLAVDREDLNIYKQIFSKGLTNAVFQFESDGMKQMLKRFKPSCFEDLIILVSMFRPGPLQYIDGVIDVKNGAKPMTFLCEELEHILGKTYGAIIYQEQVMQIVQKLAGFSLGDADNVRRYMSKKKTDKLAFERSAFIQGDKKRGIKGYVKTHLCNIGYTKLSKSELVKEIKKARKVANELFGQMQEFAKYAFNKSHATAYAFNAYLTAWLKYYYPAEFFAAALNWAGKNEKIAGLVKEARVCGVKILCPNVNISEVNFTVKGGAILFGLGSIKGIKSVAEKIVENRQEMPYLSIKDFIIRSKATKANIISLIGAGALDDFSANRTGMTLIVENIIKTSKNLAEKQRNLATLNNVIDNYVSIKDEQSLFGIQNGNVIVKKIVKIDAIVKRRDNCMTTINLLQEFLDGMFIPDVIEDKLERMKLEKEFLGVYVTAHPISLYPKQNFVSIQNAEDSERTLFGVIDDLEIKYRKADEKPMAFFNLTDETGSIKCSCFTRSYSNLKAYIAEGYGVILTGKINRDVIDVDENGNEITERNFIIENAKLVDEEQNAYYMAVSSYPLFHVNDEHAFREQHELETGGHPFFIYDEKEGKLRKALYRVDDTVGKLPNVRM